jgi:hypothetical protein
MHMWHHVTNHLIISNDKDSHSETNENYTSVTPSVQQCIVFHGGLAVAQELSTNFILPKSFSF